MLQNIEDTFRLPEFDVHREDPAMVTVLTSCVVMRSGWLPVQSEGSATSRACYEHTHV